MQDCRDNTAGIHCEMCASGFYGNASLGTPDSCRPCACPLSIASNTFAESCTVLPGDRYLCVCREGYEGHSCERSVSVASDVMTGAHRGNCAGALALNFSLSENFFLLIFFFKNTKFGQC